VVANLGRETLDCAWSVPPMLNLADVFPGPAGAVTNHHETMLCLPVEEWHELSTILR
jgi:hypothetical protein